MIERDDNIPPLNILLDELKLVRNIAENQFKEIQFKEKVA